MGENEPETESEQSELSRRTVLKTAGAGTVGGAMLAGPATASEQNADNESDSQQMSTYLILFDHTVEGRENIGGIPTAVEEGNKIANQLGAELVGLYFGSIGEYDGFGIARFPSRENAEIFRLILAQDGTHEFEVSRIWQAGEYFELIEQATSE